MGVAVTAAEHGAPTVAVDVSAVPAGFGGAGTYVRRLVESLPAAGVSPLVIARRPAGETWPGASQVLELAPTMRPVRLLWEQFGLVRSLRSRAPAVQVLHSPHYTMPAMWRRGRRDTGLAHVVTVHDLTFFTRPQDHEPAKRALFRRAIRNALAHADAIVAVSAHTADALARIGTARGIVEVIPHGIDHDRFRLARGAEAADDRDVRARLGIERPYFLHVGTIEPRKNLGTLLRAYELLLGERGDAPDLVLAGGAWRGAWEKVAPLADRINASAQRAGRARVRRLGIVADDALAPLYRGAVGVAYPSFEEGYGLPVIEALACGAAVVTSRDTVMHELGGDAVLTVDPTDPAALAGALDAMTRGEVPDAATRLRCAGSYRWPASAAAHAALYARVVK